MFGGLIKFKKYSCIQNYLFRRFNIDEFVRSTEQSWEFFMFATGFVRTSNQIWVLQPAEQLEIFMICSGRLNNLKKYLWKKKIDNTLMNLFGRLNNSENFWCLQLDLFGRPNKFDFFSWLNNEKNIHDLFGRLNKFKKCACMRREFVRST